MKSPIDFTADDEVRHHQMKTEFLARGLQASLDSKRTGRYHAARDVHRELQCMLDARRKAVSGERHPSEDDRP